MTEKVFVDSNILVYAHDADSGEKQRIAANVIVQILNAPNSDISSASGTR